MLAFFERRLRRLALGDFLAQFQIRGGQFHRALAQHFHDLIQVNGGLPRGVINFLHAGGRLNKEILLDESGAFPGRQAWQYPGERICSWSWPIQRLQPGSQRLLSHMPRGVLRGDPGLFFKKVSNAAW